MTVTPKTFDYDLQLRWDGGRTSTMTAGDRPALQGAPPADFPHGDASRWSPEHLYLAALSSCTMLSFLAHADHNGVEVESYDADISGTVRRREEDRRYAFVEVRLSPRVVVAAGQAEAARGLTPKAERDCFISASTTAEIRTSWSVTEAAGEAEPAP
jgi:organic hydroperoxide reductase OsmC/OhrA